jgi:hypothetical protein
MSWNGGSVIGFHVHLMPKASISNSVRRFTRDQCKRGGYRRRCAINLINMIRVATISIRHFDIECSPGLRLVINRETRQA